MSSPDYIERQRQLRAERLASGYYGAEQTAKREQQRQAAAEYNARIMGRVPPPIGMHDAMPGGSTPEEWPA